MSAGNTLQQLQIFDDLSEGLRQADPAAVVSASDKESLVESISRASTSRQEVVYAIMKHQWIKENPKFDPRNIPCGGKVNKATKFPTFYIEKLSSTCVLLLTRYFALNSAEDVGDVNAMDICDDAPDDPS